MKLYKRDVKFLLRNLKDATLLKRFKVYSIDDFDEKGQIILFTEEELDMLEDELGRILWEIGVSEDDEVNAQGIYIESLIDLVRNQYSE